MYEARVAPGEIGGRVYTDRVSGLPVLVLTAPDAQIGGLQRTVRVSIAALVELMQRLTVEPDEEPMDDPPAAA